MSVYENYPKEIADILISHDETPENTDKLRKFFMNPDRYDFTRRTIVFSTPSRTGTSYFRVEEPMYAIARKYPEKFNLIYADNNLNAKHLELADLIIVHRAGHLHDWLHNIYKVWPKTKKRALILHDVDDNEFNLPLRHPMREMWLSAGKDKMSVRSLKESDYVTTTGRKLQQTFRNFNKNVSIVRNMFDWSQPQWSLKRDEKYNGKIVIGWVGLTSHFEDIKKMVPILKYAHDKFLNTHFILSGMAIKDTEVSINVDAKGNKTFTEKEITDEQRTYRWRVKNLFKDFDQSRVEFYDAVELEKYGKFYKDLDIGLAYLENNTFNQCKSEIKVVEYMKAGAVPLWTNIGGYRDMFEMMPTELKIKCQELAMEYEIPEKWQKALENIIVNLDKYKETALECKKWVEEKYDINNHIDDKVEIYTNIIEQHLERETNRIQNIVATI
jgi:glycosyltransferase involved in cell wall biosynthesis